MGGQRPAACVAVAYSGGRDSTALLHVTAGAAREQGLRVAALHVHHGLQPAADAWARHCRDTCRRWAARGLPIDFLLTRLDSAPPAGDSIEAWARRERYRALRRMALAAGAGAVLLAQHRRDQAETFVLQALRGAGSAGLSAMPATVERDGIVWLRPWLQRDPCELAAYLRRHRLKHVEDPSNADPRHARSRLRQAVWPVLIEAFPDAELTLATAAGWAQEAEAIATALAAIDLEDIAGDQGLVLAGWRQLEPARRSNALRHWLRAQQVPYAASLVRRLMREADREGVACWPLPDGRVLRRHRSWLLVTGPGPAGPLAEDGTTGPLGWPARHARARHRVPGFEGSIVVRPVAEGGLDPVRLPRLRAARRVGGERFSLGPGRPARTLKQQFQALEVPAWERDGPLLHDGGQLVYVAGLGIEAGAVAAPGTPQVQLVWEPAGRVPRKA